MVAILVALVSIAVMSALMWFLNERNMLPFRICAICAGTAGTWIWLLAGIFTGVLSFTAYMPVVAILMGGSVVGIAYQSEKYLRAGRSALLWKAIFIPIGFGTAWSVTHFVFGFVILGVVVLIALAGFFLDLPLRRGRETKEAERLEHMMKDCC
ncbi:MAG: hypothetical protein Q8P88_00230 [Candidatus Jorgensenbacteria bacterium]|nr:hypothetical protein [Candidatus Jorgensenbacteria bacterium]